MKKKDIEFNVHVSEVIDWLQTQRAERQAWAHPVQTEAAPEGNSSGSRRKQCSSSTDCPGSEKDLTQTVPHLPGNKRRARAGETR